MKIAILSRDPTLYSTQRLVHTAKERGHEHRVVDPLLCFMNITSKKPAIHYREEILSGYNAVIPRIGASVTFYATAILRQFEMMGIYSLNDSMAIARARDKLRALQVLARKGVGLPVTGFAHSTQKTSELIELVGGPPLVIKLLEGTQGKGVILAETQSAAESVIDAFRNLNAYFLVQEFIQEAAGSDLRCFVVGDKVIAGMLRTAKSGEFRSNLHRGGAGKKVKVTPEERRSAINATKAMGLNTAGVDILRSHRGPLVMEVNPSPGLEGIENRTGIDVATKMFEHIEKHAERGPRGKG